MVQRSKQIIDAQGSSWHSLPVTQHAHVIPLWAPRDVPGVEGRRHYRRGESETLFGYKYGALEREGKQGDTGWTFQIWAGAR